MPYQPLFMRLRRGLPILGGLCMLLARPSPAARCHLAILLLAGFIANCATAARGERRLCSCAARRWIAASGQRIRSAAFHDTAASAVHFGADRRRAVRCRLNPIPRGAGAAGNSPANPGWCKCRSASRSALTAAGDLRAAAQEGSPFASGLFRLPTLGLPPGLETPKPTAEQQRQFDQFVQQEASPENTLQVVVGRSKILVLREAPRRVYIPREDIAEYQLITPTQLSVVGRKVGTAVLSLWFADQAAPNDPTRDHLLTLPSPRASRSTSAASGAAAAGVRGKSLPSRAQGVGNGNQARVSR